MAFELFATFEEGQFNQEGDARDMPTQLLYKLHSRRHSATRGQQIIHNQDTLTRTNGIGVHLYDVGAIFEGILNTYCLRWKFAKFTHRHKTTIQQEGQQRTKNKAA